MSRATARMWPPAWTDQDNHTATLDHNGQQLRRYDGVWCAQDTAGLWRNAAWAGVRLGDVLDAHPHVQPVGQTQLQLIDLERTA